MAELKSDQNPCCLYRPGPSTKRLVFPNDTSWAPPWTPVRFRTAGKYDIADDHSTYRPESIDEYLPGARLFALSRDPVARIVSALSFFLHKTTQDYANTWHQTPPELQGHLWNSVAWQFDVPAAKVPLEIAEWQREGTRLQHANASVALAAIEERFDLVLLTERLPESLVLLRALLCWDWTDIILQGEPLTQVQQGHLRAAAASPNRARANMPLDNATTDRLLQLNGLDVRLHAQSVTKFERLIESYGPAFPDDVALYKRFAFAFQVVCLGCCADNEAQSTPRGVPPALEHLQCGSFMPTCQMLVKPFTWNCSGANHTAASVATARMAEQSLLDVLESCGPDLQNVTACRRTQYPQHFYCYTGEMCMKRWKPRLLNRDLGTRRKPMLEFNITCTAEQCGPATKLSGASQRHQVLGQSATSPLPRNNSRNIPRPFSPDAQYRPTTAVAQASQLHDRSRRSQHELRVAARAAAHPASHSSLSSSWLPSLQLPSSRQARGCHPTCVAGHTDHKKGGRRAL